MAGDTDVYIDPQTKLPMALGDYEVSYEEPPQGHVRHRDSRGRRRGGQATRRIPPGPEPLWMVQERQKEETGEIAQSCFEQGRPALAAGQYAAAVDSLTKTIEISPKRNWAQFWLGKALYEVAEPVTNSFTDCPE